MARSGKRLGFLAGWRKQAAESAIPQSVYPTPRPYAQRPEELIVVIPHQNTLGADHLAEPSNQGR